MVCRAGPHSAAVMCSRPVTGCSGIQAARDKIWCALHVVAHSQLGWHVGASGKKPHVTHSPKFVVPTGQANILVLMRTGQLTYMRLYQGSLKKGDTIYHVNSKQSQKKIKVPSLMTPSLMCPSLRPIIY